jgi:PKD domain-containing protein
MWATAILRSLQARRGVAAAIVVGTLVLLALVSRASADVTASVEPSFTRTTGNNSYWFHWTAVTGIDANGNTDYTYFLCLATYHNNVQEEFSNGTNGPGSQNCTTSLRNGAMPASGDNAFVPYANATVLQDGHLYTMCATPYRAYVALWSSDVGDCSSTVIDRNNPALGVTLAGGAALTNSATVPVAISYVDATSPPWRGSNGYASNWVCIAQGASCAPGGQSDPKCSAPVAGFDSRINAFDCAMSIGGGDGVYYFCAQGADNAVPDNPNGPNQFQFALSNNANLSDIACDNVTLDRVAPAITVSTSAATVTVGSLVNFSMSASDPNGLSGTATWDFGDNTAHTTGSTATHTYTQTGTYVARATQNDAAGNSGSGTRTITVKAAGAVGSAEGTTGATPVTGNTTTATLIERVVHDAGGGGARTVALGSVKVIAPKRFVAGRRTMLVAVKARARGSLKLALLKGSKVIAAKGATLARGGTYTLRLRMPRKLTPGSYVLRVSYKAAGAAKATTKRLGLKVTGATTRYARAATADAITTPARRTARLRARRPSAA